jgi:copper chaperone
MMKESVKIEGMSCQHCVAAVRKALNALEGIDDVEVDLEKGEARFRRSANVNDGQIRRAVEKAGYSVSTQ